MIAGWTMNFFIALRNLCVLLLRRRPEYVWLDVRGELPEFSRRVGVLRRRLLPSPGQPSLEEIRYGLEISRRAGVGVLLRVGELGAGFAALEELRREIVRFREAGGRVAAYLDSVDTRSYYLACAAERIFCPPSATVAVTGVRTRVTFLKDALDRIGVEAEVLAVSPYKSAGEVFTRNDFSREAREQAERLLERRYEALVEAIAHGRNLTPEKVRELVDGAPYGAGRAVELGLIDGACYEDELPGVLGVERKRVAGWGAARRALPRPYRSTKRRKVAVVELRGTITRGRSRRLPLPVPLVGAEQAGSDSVVRSLRAAEGSRSVAAVLFLVDSGGGDALASDLIWREVERIRRKKPVVALMGNAAASGGYYVCAPASHIVARSTTLTGSIGVFVTRPVALRLYRRVGVHPVSIERGRHAGIFDESRPPTEEEMRILGEELRRSYEEFKEKVCRGRGIPVRSLERIAGGRVWSGAEAHEIGLVDEIGGFREALSRAGELAGIEGVSERDLVRVGEPKGYLVAGELLEEPEEVTRSLTRAFGSGVWAAMPYHIGEHW